MATPGRTTARQPNGQDRREIVCGDGGETAALPGNSVPITLDLNGSELTVLVAANQPLQDMFEDKTATSPEPGVRAPKSAENTHVAADGRGYPKGLDLLLDVELPVSVSFGRAELPIKDVIKLTTGSIVELNRSIAEPVEIIVNNVVIARGDVVVVEGNFGVRIKQVISRQERLRTLR